MIENTSRRDPFVHLRGAMSDGLDGYITGMEADGQRQVVGGAEMPIEGPWEELEALGFVRGQSADELFVTASLPDGWRKEPTDHSMWSKIVDERGIERVSIFYKAAFYDRRAFCRVVHVGAKLANDAIWGEGKPKLPDCWGKLTDAEKADYRSEFERALRDENEKRPYFAANPEGMKISDEHGARIQACIALLPAAAGA